MNLYPTDLDPAVVAQRLADDHLRSQIADLALVLFAAIVRMEPGPNPDMAVRGGRMISRAHLDDQLVAWCASKPARWAWTWGLLMALHDEHLYRFRRSRSDRALAFSLPELAGTVLDLKAQHSTPTEWPRRSAAGRRSGLENEQASARAELAWRYAGWIQRGRSPTWTRRDAPELFARASQIAEAQEAQRHRCRELLERTPTFTAPEVAALLGVTLADVKQLGRSRQLLAVQDGGAHVYPAWQFGDGRALDGLAEVLEVLAGLSAFEVLEWFSADCAELGCSPALRLAAGQVDEVVAAAGNLEDT